MPTFVPINQANGAAVIEYGAMQPYSLPAATGVTIFPAGSPKGIQCRDRQDMSLVVRASGTAAFNLDYEFSTDQGATWQVGQQVNSTVNTVDDTTAGYVQGASFDISVGWWFRVNIYNPSGAPITVVAEWRFYSAGG
jgi:hypothetical protein